ncbi:MAG: hypothetical protein WCO71_11100 [Pseudomonadota bacterium]
MTDVFDIYADFGELMLLPLTVKELAVFQRNAGALLSQPPPKVQPKPQALTLPSESLASIKRLTRKKVEFN